MCVFISYSHQDREFAKKIVFEISKFQENYCIDECELEIGDSLTNRVLGSIKDNSLWLLILSGSICESEWYLDILSDENDREVVNNKGVGVLPILIDEVDIPKSLKKFIYADFTKEYSLGLHTVIENIINNNSKGRLKTHGAVFDWGIDWGIIENIFRMQVNIVRSEYQLPISTILEIQIEANDIASNRYIELCAENRDWGLHPVLKE